MALTPRKRKDLLDQLAGWFTAFEDRAAPWMKLEKRHSDYYHDAQWTQAEKSTLDERKEPCVTDNLIKDKIDNMLGLEISGRTDPRAYPRTPVDTDGADAITDALRFVADNTELQRRFSEAAEGEWVTGTGALEVVLDDPETGEIAVRRIHPDRIWYDTASRELDFSDARFLGTVIWLDEDQAKARFPGAANARALRASYNADQQSYMDDKTRWADSKRKRVRVFETYWKQADGEVWYATWTRGGFLTRGGEDSPGPSAYRDDRGTTAWPYIWQSAYINSEGRRYGLVQRLIDLQDEVNKRRSKALHFLNTNQLHYEDGALKDPEYARFEIKKPDGVVKYNRGALTDGRVRIDKNIELAAGNVQILQDTRERLDNIGPAESLAGLGGESGRHLQVQQQGQVLQLGPLFDRHQSLKRRTYRAIWHRVKQFWGDERWIRVMDKERNFTFTGLNVPMEALAATPQGQQMVLNNETLPEVMNPVADMDFDIVLEDVPDVVNLAQEQFAALVDLAKMGITFPQEFYIEVANLPNKSKLREMLKEFEQRQAQAQQGQNEAQAQVFQAQLAKLNSETAENMAEAQHDVAAAKLKAVEAFLKANGLDRPQSSN